MPISQHVLAICQALLELEADGHLYNTNVVFTFTFAEPFNINLKKKLKIHEHSAVYLSIRLG